MDLAKLNTAAASDQGFELQLIHPVTMANLGVFITVLGKDSATYRDVLNQHSRKRVDRAQRTGSMKNLSMDELERDSLDLLAACTKNWRQAEEGAEEKLTLTVDGEELHCSRENAAKLYSKYAWIKEQIDAAIADRANFLPR